MFISIELASRCSATFCNFGLGQLFDFEATFFTSGRLFTENPIFVHFSTTLSRKALYFASFMFK